MNNEQPAGLQALISMTFSQRAHPVESRDQVVRQ